MTTTSSSDARRVPRRDHRPRRRVPDLVGRLSRQSVEKGHDAYRDVPWDDPDHALSVDDPRVELFAFDPLAHTDWYRSADQETRNRVGLHRIGHSMKVGMQFENLLQRGLLSYAFRMRNDDPEFRYVHHEIIEESQHSLMFQEFVNRTGQPIGGMPRSIRVLATVAVPVINRLSPPLFFMLVLGGEDPIDHLQRRQLREGRTHPLTEHIMRIHVAEEARHIAYARTFLKDRVPELGPIHRHVLALAVPVVVSIMAPLMVEATMELHHRQGVPREAIREARRSSLGRQPRKDAAAKQRRLCRELGLMTGLASRVWKRLGYHDEDDQAGSVKPSK